MYLYKLNYFIICILDNSSKNVSKINVSSACSGFVCKNPPERCLSKNRLCDKNVDCFDAEDEINCPSFEVKLLNSSVDNNESNVNENSEDYYTEINETDEDQLNYSRYFSFKT